MDILVCGAPLDNSFQKDKLELVNKGSLGHRRKPTRANIKNLLSPSNHNVTLQATTLKDVPLSVPASRIKPKVNGHVYSERNCTQNLKPQQKIEPSLIRTSPEPNHVADAQQFSIEAKLKRKKSEAVGRSAVLIQTWERRTWSNSLTRQKETSVAKARDRHSSCDHCLNKENTFRNRTMPEPHTCQRYTAGNAQKGESFKKGGLASRARDSYADDAMLYRVPDNRPRYIKQLSMNGRKPTTGRQEPEWISLSKKLCAKFVEGYIEPDSADSYLHEEPDGVKEQPKQILSQHRPPHQTQTIPQRVVEEKKPKRKVVDNNMTPSQTIDPQPTEPPWIHLSRKLCTKFIEEHIEYPVVPVEESLKKALLVEPNGDVRIIEKVGKPKGRKSKVRKDSEPEWISISRKLRAKFIESHIDDPDTISMDNQLNASDPELSSESLSDTSQDAITSEKRNLTQCHAEYKDFSQSNIEKVPPPNSYRNRFLNNSYTHTSLPEKERCWEYQEMEFDQESNSGTFQEAEFSEDSINDCTKTSKSDVYKSSRSVAPGNIEKQRFLKEKGETFTSFAETVNSQMFRNAECYNNDVRFAPHETNTDKSRYNNSEPEKMLTVQFISHRNKTNQDYYKNRNNDISPERNNGQSVFFNLTTWEEAHSKSAEPNTIFKLKSELRSKSMDNICDSDENYLTKHEMSNSNRNTSKVNSNDNLPLAKGKTIFKSEDVLDKLECKITTHKGGSRSRKIGCFEENVYKTRIDQFNGNSEIFEVGGNGVSENVSTSRLTSSDSFESFEIAPESFEDNAEIFIDSGTESAKRFDEIEKDTAINNQAHNSNENGFKNRETTRIDTSPNCSSRSSRRKSSEDFETTVNCNPFYPEFQSNGNGSENFNGTEYESTLVSRENNMNVGKLEDFKITENNTDFNCPAQKLSRKTYKNFETDEDESSFTFCKSLENSENPKELSTETSNSCASFKTQEDIEDSERDKRSNSHSSNSPKFHSGVDKAKFRQCSENGQGVSVINDQKPTGMKKHYKCNGTIPNSKEIKLTASSKPTKVVKEEKITNGFYSERQKQMKDNDATSVKPEKLCVNEYANISSVVAERKPLCDVPSTKMGTKSKSVHSVFHEVHDSEEGSRQEMDSRRNSSGEYHDESNTNVYKRALSDGSNYSENIDSTKNTSMKTKCQSMYDISKKENVYENSQGVGSKNKIPMFNGISNVATKSRNGSTMTFQEFASESDIPLCAKLVSKQNGKLSVRSVSSSSNRNTSPCSESSHVYEDMFKETTSCPSDSETSSWTVMKTNSYYINGRSSSMNDLDLSDSCSMSVKCDYASSGSEHSTLQSRQSSCTSSSFYVNLRDYDSHMLEPSLNRKKKDSKKATSKGKSTKLANSNPPTPESLRHLFTSPFHSINSPANRTARLANRLPQEEPHYYSTAAATSSAFKHSFDPAPPKQKKTERSSSVKIKDIAQGIILTFRRFQNHSKSSNVSPNHYVDVSHLAESNHTESGKQKSKKEQKEISKKQDEKKRWGFSSENSRTDSDSGCHLSPSDVHGPKARRSSSDLSGNRPKLEIPNADMKSSNGEKKKIKSGKKVSNAREKAKKTRSKSIEPRPISTVSRKVQQMPDGTLYLVTTVSGDTALPGVYSDSPDSSSELSSHRPVKLTGESNC